MMREEHGTLLKKILIPAIIGAAYAVLTMLLGAISYGPLQFRVSEALCVMPFFLPNTAWGLFAGCLIANLMSAAGPLDIVFGSLATLLSGLCIARIGISGRNSRKSGGMLYPVLACAMPVLFNGPIVGAVLAYTIAPAGEAFAVSFLTFGLQVAIGELAVMYLIGLPLLRSLQKLGADGFLAHYGA